MGGNSPVQVIVTEKPRNIGEDVIDGLTKIYTFVTSRRVQFFALVSGILFFVGVLGLPADQNAAILAQLKATTDKGVELIIVAREFATEVIALVGLIVMAYQTMKSMSNRPITLQDHKTTILLPALSPAGPAVTNIQISEAAPVEVTVEPPKVEQPPRPPI